MASLLWKPSSERDGNLVILFPELPGRVVIRDASSGQIIATGQSSGSGNGRADQIRFPNPGSAFNNVIIETSNGESFFIDNGAVRRDNISLAPPGRPAASPSGNADPGGAGDLSSIGGGAGGVGGLGVPGVGNVASPFLLDPSLVQSNPIFFPSIPQAEFTFTDPLESAGRTAAFNREQTRLNFLEGIRRAQALQRGELGAVQEFATGISETQQQLVAAENAFNQAQRLAAAEVAIPGVEGTLERQRERAETLSEGRLLTTAEDRAIELAARSASADTAITRGFGADSVIGRRQSELLSAQQRLDIAQIGESFLNRSLQQAQGLLFDTPLKANISQRLPAQPSVPFASIVQAQQQAETAATTISPGQALTATIQQEQFSTGVEESTNRFNATGEFQATQFNSNQEFQAQLQELGIVAANTQAVNTFNQNVLNDRFNQAQFEKFEERLEQSLSLFQKNRDQAQLFQALGTIFGRPSKIPEFVLDVVESIAGSDFIDGLFGGGDTFEDIPDVFVAGVETLEDLDIFQRPAEALPDFINIDAAGNVDITIPDFDFEAGQAPAPGFTLDSEASLNLGDPFEFAGLI